MHQTDYKRRFTALLACLFLGLMSVRATDVPSVLVRVEPARFNSMSETLTTYGMVEYSPEGTEILDILSQGLVTKVWVAAGQKVRQGDPLLEIKATINAETDLEKARIAVTFSQKDLDRVKKLREFQLATKPQVQAAEENLAKAKASLNNVQQRIGQQATRELRADMDGFVESVNVNQGDIVASGAPLLRLAKGDRFRVRLGVEPEDLLSVRDGQTVRIVPLYFGAHSLDSKIHRIYYRVNPKTRLAEVVVPLPAMPEILPGEVVRGEIVIKERLHVLVVPRQAVLRQDNRDYVFVYDHGIAHLRWVNTGLEQGSLVEIKSGLNVGEQIVVTGNYELRDGIRLRIQDRH